MLIFGGGRVSVCWAGGGVGLTYGKPTQGTTMRVRELTDRLTTGGKLWVNEDLC